MIDNNNILDTKNTILNILKNNIQNDENKIVLKASAGTGKTYRLSLEFIANLIKGVDYKEILVMTFTKKATAEIKERIYDFLYQIAFNKGNGKELENSLNEIYNIEDKINKEKLQNIYFDMIKNKDDMRIFTIDGFTNRIFKNAIAPSLGIYNFETLDSEEDTFYGEILAKILNDKDLYEKFKFIIEEKEDKKNIETYIDFIKNIIYMQKDYLLAKEYKNNDKVVANTIFLESLEKIFEHIDNIKSMKNKENDIGFIIKDFQDIYLKFKNIDNEQDSDIAENKRQKIEVILQNWEVFYKGENGNINNIEEMKNIWNGNKVKTSKSVDTTNIINEMRDLKEPLLKSLSKYIYIQKILPLHNKLKEFSEEIYEILEKTKIDSKRFTHDDISTYTYKFIFDKKLKFVENNKVSDKFLDSIGGNIETIMIDEFQDTSIMQWKILKLLVSNAKNVICVGDEKQSIYSWRGGEKELFENLEKIIGAKIENLGKSYRSYKEIIENVNKIYTGYRKDWEYIPVEYRGDTEYQKGYFSYNLKVIDNEDNQEENNKNYENIISMIKNKKIKNLGKTCIICRRNAHLNEIVSRLNKENIPYTLNSNASILEHSAVKPIYRLMKYFLYNNSIYLLEFLRSDLIGCLNSHITYFLENKEDIEKYINGFGEDEEYSKYVENNKNYDYLKEYKNIDILERNNLSFLDILTKIRKLKRLSKNLNSFELSENFSKEIIKIFEITKYYSTNSDVKNIFNFFNILKEYNDLFEFINYIEEKQDKITQLSSGDVEAINLMSIHKSKGLEFDTVFYYKRDSKKIDREEITSYLEFDNNFEKVEKFLVVFKKYKKTFIDGHYYELKQEINRKNEIEEINGDYVALTRAKKNLILLFDILINKDGEYKNELVKKLVEKYNIEKLNSLSSKEIKELEYNSGEIIESQKEIKDNIVNTEEQYTKLSNIMKYFEDNKIKYTKSSYETDLESEFRRKKGLAMHYYLEHLLNNLDEDKKIAKSVYINRYGNLLGKKLLNELLERMENFINKNREIYNSKYKVYTEFEIFDENGDKKIIDRINIDEEKREIYIYDYKTGFEPLENEKYKHQIEEYKNILEKKTNGKYKIFTKILEV